MFKKKLFWIVFLLLLIIPSFIFLVRPGFFPIQDDMQVFRLFELDKCIKDFQIPCRWIPDGGYGYGYPQFNFYAPLVYYVSEIFHLIGFQFIDSIKIVFVLGFIFAAVAMFILAREFFGEFPALVAAVLYTYAPYHAQQVYVRGSLSEFFASVFFPLILWALYKIIKEGKRKHVVFGALSIAGLFLTHNILSFLFIPILLFWVIYWLVAEKKSNWKKVILSLALGLGLSSFFLLPMLFERQYVHVETLLGGYFDYRQHFVTLKQLFLSNHWGYGSSAFGPVDDLSLSTGILHWIAGLAAVLVAVLKFRKDKKGSLLILGLGVIELTVLFLMHERSSFLWTQISPLSWLQFPWRFLSLSVFILAFLSAYLVSILSKYRIQTIFAPIMALVHYRLHPFRYPEKADYKWDFLGAIFIGTVFAFYVSFFHPKTWLDVRDVDELTGAKWERQLTASIFDYLPIYAKLPPNSKAPEKPEVLDGSAIFISYNKGSDLQGGEVKVYETSTVRFPVYDFPGMTVRANGEIVSHVNNDCRNQDFCLGLVTAKLPVGSYKVSVMLEDTPVRNFSNLLTLSSILLLIYIGCKKGEKYTSNDKNIEK